MRKIIQAVTKRIRRLDSIDARLERVQEALGRVEARQTSSAPNLRDAEFRTFSQWGEDGIIQALIRSVPIGRNIFIEFGVQDYSESNTRFLLLNDNWSGLVIDGDAGPFSGAGDTGAIVFRLDDFVAVGLLFGSSRAEEKTYAHDLAVVLRILHLRWL